tara:strand:+ start:266009 stop:266845 length:837 start_codon:yes stop_codon:yes gene_type:complete
MKKLYTLVVALIITTTSFAQAPNKMSYQAIVRDINNNLLADTTVGTQISILQGSISGTAVYVETISATTNTNGLVTFEIGTGTLVSGDFSNIDWGTDTFFLKTETDPAGGTDYTITGTSQMLSVPYALYAKTSGSSLPGPAGQDGADGLLSSGTTAGNTPYWDGSEWITNSSNIHNNGGNVGIGVDDPSTKLEVSGIVTATGLNSIGLDVVHSLETTADVDLSSSTFSKSLIVVLKNTGVNNINVFYASWGGSAILSPGSTGTFMRSSPNDFSYIYSF